MNLDEYCAQNKFVHISKEEIQRTLTPRNVLEFRCGETILAVKIPDDLQKEIRTIATSTWPIYGLVFSIDTGLEFDANDLAWKAHSAAFSWIAAEAPRFPKTKIAILTPRISDISQLS